MSESCESTAFSLFINAEGKFFPCSFMDGKDEWQDGIDIATVDDFVKDVWMNPRVKAFREKLMANVDKYDNRICPCYEV